MSWSFVGGLAVTCVIMGQSEGFSVLLSRAVLPGVGLALLIGALAVGRVRGDARLVAGATAFLQMTLFTILAVVLSFVLAAQAMPLWDARLAATDAQLGFAWPAILAAADRMPPVLLLVGGTAYHSLIAQMIFAILVLAGTGRIRRLRVMVAAAIVSGCLTVLASGLAPAVGNLFDPGRYDALWPSVAWLDHGLIGRLRDGSMRQIDLSHMTGIVSFPSYHAALPVILVWGLRPISKLRVPAALWAGLTVAATPLFGGHYVADVLAGLLLACGAIAVARQLPAGKEKAERMLWLAHCGTRPARAIDLYLPGQQEPRRSSQ